MAEEKAIEGLPSEFDYFTKPIYQAAILDEYDQDFAPLAPVQAGSPIDFHIPPTSDLYRDLNNTKLMVQCKLTKADNSAVGANDVGPVNLLLHSLFSSIDLKLDGTSVNDTSDLYPYRAFLETILNYDHHVLKTRGYLEGWEKDTAGKLDITTAAANGTNAGLVARVGRFGTSAVVTLMGRLHLDLFHQNKDIPSFTDIQLRLTPNNNKFLLLNAAPADDAVQEIYKVVITEAKLFVRTKKVSPSLMVAHQQVLQSTPFRMDFTKVTMQKLQIASGVSTITLPDLYLGTIPDRVAIGFVRDDALAGSYTLNPFNFEHSNISSIKLEVNSEQVPKVALEPNFAKAGSYLREYMYTLDSLGYDTGQHIFDLTPVEWANGFTIFAFKLTGGPLGTIRAAPRTGVVRLSLKFSQATARNISAIVMAEQPATLEIDKYHHVVIA